MEALRNGPPRAAWIAAVLFVLLLMPKIGAGTLWHHDELLTANRAREMLVRGDPFAVTLNFAPSVKKPPLQYWVCALLLRALPGHPEFAVRLPTLLAGAACLLAAAWLARITFPNEGAPLAAWTALALAGCGYLIHDCRIALLDPGAALLLTLALAGCQLARKEPRWWWFVALLCILGAWQKAPYGIAAWGLLMLAHPFFSRKAPETRSLPLWEEARWHYHQPAAFAVACWGALGWWYIQWARQSHGLLMQAGFEQTRMFLRAHDPADAGFRPWVYWMWLARDWFAPGLCAPVAAAAALLAMRRERPPGELGLVCVVFGAITACLIYRSERYLVLITPALAVLVAAWLKRVSARLPAGARAWVLPLAIASTLPVAAFHYFEPAPARPDLLAIARELGASGRPGEWILVKTDAESGFDAPEFVLFYSGLRQPVEEMTLQAIEELPIGFVRCRGICGSAQWETLKNRQPSFREIAERGKWVLWAN